MPLLILLIALLAPPAPAAAAAWVMPAHGAQVAGRFHVLPARPFAAGQRRGIDLRVAPGAPVGAACSGVVTYAGPLPGRSSIGVTVRCGALVATHLGLAAAVVRRGAPVFAGMRLGTAGRTGVVRLGARRAGQRIGYVDPLLLIGRPRPAPPLAPEVPRAPRAPRRPTGQPARAARPPLPSARVHPAPPVSLLAWLGAALLAAGLGVHVGLWRRTTRRRREVTAVRPSIG